MLLSIEEYHAIVLFWNIVFSCYRVIRKNGLFIFVGIFGTHPGPVAVAISPGPGYQINGPSST